MKRALGLVGSALLFAASSAQLPPKLQPVYLPIPVESPAGVLPVAEAAIIGADGNLYMFDPATKEYFPIDMPSKVEAEAACGGNENAHIANMVTETKHKTGAPIGVDYDGYAVCAPGKGLIIKEATAIYTVPDDSTGEYTVEVTVDGEPLKLH